MKTDRELLELAARAAGYEVLFWSDKCSFKEVPYKLWNPLTDDGDALRLAVRLKISVSHILIDGAHAQWDAGVVTEAYSGNHCAATRRAIVRAAAEIGSQIAAQGEVKS